MNSFPIRFCFWRVLGLACLATLSGGQIRSHSAENRAKILLIGHALDHPYGSHMYLHECGLLAKCLRQTPGVEAIVSDGWPKDPGMLAQVNAIAMYTSPGGTILLHTNHRAQAEQLLKSGVGLAAIHWATDARVDLGQDYLKALGGWWSVSFGGLEVTDTRVAVLDPAHPVCRGWGAFDLNDEIYLRTVLMNAARPLLKATVKDGEQIVAWTYERPNANGGRSFGTTLGHFHRNFGLEPFRRLLVNGILWSAHVDVPAHGAAVQITTDDMTLPADPRSAK